jgi:hypothetical protein
MKPEKASDSSQVLSVLERLKKNREAGRVSKLRKSGKNKG